jgi:AAA15 family ATPase/GTPase
MLLQFAVQNYRSFNDEVVLNLMPVKSRIHPDHVMKSEDQGPKVSALPLAVLYGANASGKSNLLRAMAFSRGLVLAGTRPDQAIPTVPFRLDEKAAKLPSRFEFVIKAEGVVYSYGLAVTTDEVAEEWLFARRGRGEQRLFERATRKGKVEVKIGAAAAPSTKEKHRLEFVAEGTRPNQPFLTEAWERATANFGPVMRWFRDLRVVGHDSRYAPLAPRAQDPAFADFLGRLLAASDTGISAVRPEEVPLDRAAHLPGMGDEAFQRLLDSLEENPRRWVFLTDRPVPAAVRRGNEGRPVFLALKTAHTDVGGQEVAFDATEESDGTLRLLHLAPLLAPIMLDSPSVYLVDELDRSLHPQLSRMFLEAYLTAKRAGVAKGQLIVTTHETNLLDLSLLRRDEIWFMEKDAQGASHLTSLAQFKYQVRNDLKLEKGYLAGRFGAIPFLGDPKALFGKKKRGG